VSIFKVKIEEKNQVKSINFIENKSLKKNYIYRCVYYIHTYFMYNIL